MWFGPWVTAKMLSGSVFRKQENRIRFHTPLPETSSGMFTAECSSNTFQHGFPIFSCRVASRLQWKLLSTKNTYKGKSKLAPWTQLVKLHTMKTYRGVQVWRHFFDLGTSLRWVVGFTLLSLYPLGKSPLYPLDRKLGGLQNRSRLCGEKKSLVLSATIRTELSRLQRTLNN
jgi:hypothetical protein